MTERNDSLEVLARVICRDKEARYLLVPEEDLGGDKTILGLPLITEYPSSVTDCTISESGLEIVTVEPFHTNKVNKFLEVHTFLGKLVNPLAISPKARWLFPSVLINLQNDGNLAEGNVAGVLAADQRLSW